MTDHDIEMDFKKYIWDQSECIFADRAKLVFGPELKINGLKFQTFNNVYSSLSSFSSNILDYNLDGFVIGIYESNLTHSMKGLKRLTKKLLLSLLAEDVGYGPARTIISKAGNSNWWLPFEESKYFVLIFAPFYPDSNPRTTHGLDASFFIFQPKYSFDRRIEILGGIENWQNKREAIRRAHLSSGMSYDFDLKESDKQGAKFIEPLNNGDVIKWWNANVSLS